MKDYRHYFKILFYESVLNDLIRHYIIEYKPKYYKDKIRNIFKKIKTEIEKEIKDDLL